MTRRASSQIRSTIEATVRALRRQVLGQLETPEHHLHIDPNDLVRAPARVDRKEDGDQPPHDMGVAVALEAEARRGPGGGAIDLGREPDLTGAAANFVRLRSRRFRQQRQGAAELDHVAIAVLPVIQKLEVREDVLEGHGLQLICDRRHHVASHWLWSDNQHGRVEIARLSRNATDIDLDFGSCLDCAFQKVRRVVIGINLNSGSSQRKDAAFTNQSY
jgi:hypothetical protein